MSNKMNQKYGLLLEQQVFGDHASEAIRAIGAQCEATDFARISGAEIDEQGNGGWFLASKAGYGDVCIVCDDGSRGVAYSTSHYGIRPVMSAGGSDGAVAGSRVEIGEYPQQACSKELSRILEGEFYENRLRKTGKSYMAEYSEYIYEDAKYIRADYLSAASGTLSNGRTYKQGDKIWIEVSPVVWLIDHETDLLISEKILAFGPAFDRSNHYDGDFSKTDVCRFLNERFAEDIVPSRPKDLTEDEENEYREGIKRSERRRNPYDLKFGEVTEEDIIRGAIESDVAVFLHGPSSEGKSARVKQIDPTCEIIYLRNATPDSLNGRSVYNQSTGEMIDIPPTWYKKVKAKCEAEPDKLHVVFFDEINNALPSIQGMAFNIVLDREVNGLWKLPENARVVAAGNDMQDSLAANQIAAPFFNRFAHVYINTTTEKWLKWARENRIHPAIYAYIAYKKGETLRSEYTGEKPNADPRKWEMASKMLYATGQPEMLRSLIGEDITDEFVQFCNQPVITLRDVLSGNYTDSEIDALNTSERYATTMGLSQADDDSLDVVRAFVERLGAEFLKVFDTMRHQK
ncbi:MAG: ATP-binding protein [Bacillota bacterium]|nr:ATP-binding protein [Bacillota bacterium]